MSVKRNEEPILSYPSTCSLELLVVLLDLTLESMNYSNKTGIK